jgi:hypothetical protein
LIFLVGGATDPSSMLSDMPLLLSIWVPLGLAPLVGGWFLFRYGLRKDREKRQIAKSVPQDDTSK